MKVGLPARKLDRVYRYRDYKDWPDDERWELIHGVAWNMSPAPSVSHQTILGRLHIAVGRFLPGPRSADHSGSVKDRNVPGRTATGTVAQPWTCTP